MSQGDNEEIKKNTTNLAYELTDLVPYNEYNIWVQAVNDNGPGASTGEIKIRTYGASPSNPPNVTVEAASSTVKLIFFFNKILFFFISRIYASIEKKIKM